MDPTQHKIFLKGELKTEKIIECKPNAQTGKVSVKFTSGRTFNYNTHNVLWLQDPEYIEPEHCQMFFSDTKKRLEHMTGVWEFTNGKHTYWHIKFDNGIGVDFDDKQLVIIKSCLGNTEANNVFQYFSKCAKLNNLKTEDGTILLDKVYSKMDFIPEDTALAHYLNPKKSQKILFENKTRIFPFGCNASQQKAVERAFQNNFSVIQGPPGTGKTQTILNIIANILIEKDKSVLVVSNNNSAIENVQEKLEKNGYGFLTATLGKLDNKKTFLEQQTDKLIPDDIKDWFNKSVHLNEIQSASNRLNAVFDVQEKLAKLKEEMSQLHLESIHFREDYEESIPNVYLRKRASSTQIYRIWNNFKSCFSSSQNGTFSKLKWWWYSFYAKHVIGLSGIELTRNNLSAIILGLQNLFYTIKEEELENQKTLLETQLEILEGDKLLKQLTELSTNYLRNRLAEKYGNDRERIQIDGTIMAFEPKKFVDEYPIILSTAFSARSCLPKYEYDYVIMDEASQVSVEIGVLALSVAKNVIIVGDSQQLPNVQTNEDKVKLDAIFQEYNISDAYNSTKYSFLDSVLQIIPNISSTLLREHYRCSPPIIDFCNQKFYGGNLLIMTNQEEDLPALKLIRTVEGNHQRGMTNRREAEVIMDEVLPNLDYEDVGVIAPYNAQVNLIDHMLTQEIDVSTVHKFQGREKDTIIMDCVANEANEFTDDPNLMNVAVSRAKKQLVLVVSQNEQPEGSNLADLIHYISYQKGEVIDSKIHSIFDLLYEQNDQKLSRFLETSDKVSAFASERLTYMLLKKLLQEVNYLHLAVKLGYPLNRLLGDFTLLNEEEKAFATNDLSHVDFLIFNRVSKMPVLVIETDGHAFHVAQAAQQARDGLKDAILAKYNIPLLRLSTTGSREEDKIRALLEKYL